MAAVEVTITGVLYDKYARTSRPVVLIGEATLTGLGVGGGPMPPGQGGGGDPPGIWGGPIDPYPDHGLPGRPPGIWGGPIDPYPDHGLPGRPPGIWGPNDPRPTPPIYLPPGYPGGPNVPPGLQPPEPPAPGSPTTPVPPPEGSSGWPVASIVPPPYVVVQYPGIGPVYVAPPASQSEGTPPDIDPAPTPTGRRG